jgi:L-threonylcarbamoyladenylate synthase
VPILPPERSDEVVAALLAGGVAGIPTDTVYGIAALPGDETAVRELARLKGRSEQQPIALLIDDLDAFASNLDDPGAIEPARRFWPGALTVVVRVREGYAAAVVTPERTVGARVPDDELARAVIRACGGALAVTSANRAGEPPATSAPAVAAIFGPELLVLDGGARDGGVASTVVDVTGDEPRILRPGPIGERELLAAFARA